MAIVALPVVGAAGPLSGSILFVRAQFDESATPISAGLWLYSFDAQVAQPLTPLLKGVRDGAGSWSPDGSRIAFERTTMHGGRPARHGIFLLDTRNGRVRPLTVPNADYRAPAWGPGNRIAVAAIYADRSCVSLLTLGAPQPADLFCPPQPVQVIHAVWLPGGRSLLVDAGHMVGRLDPHWRSLVYRVDAGTGAARLISDLSMDWQLQLEFAPDGRSGVYADFVPSDLVHVDFSTHAVRVLGWGYAPRWSKDGRRIAYTGEVYEIGAEFRYYNPLFVMNADGSAQRRVTLSRIDNHAYVAADWSQDDAHVLATRRTFADVSLTVPRDALRIIDVDTRAERVLPDGSAQPGAWFEP